MALPHNRELPVGGGIVLLLLSFGLGLAIVVAALS